MDVFENIVKYLPINDINNISILDKEIYEITKYIIQKRLSNLRNHSKLIIKIKEYFLNNVNKPYSNELLEATLEIQKTLMHTNYLVDGLYTIIKEFITSKYLSVKEIVELQEIGEKNDEDINELYLINYFDENKNELPLTLGIIIKSLMNSSIRVFFKGYAYNLKIYYENRFLDRTYAKSLPKCCDGDFFSWGYADRIGGVGNFEDYKLLDKNSVINYCGENNR